MNIYLVRHGETDWNKKRILMGRADVPLNSDGIMQAEATAKKLAKVDFDVCFYSPQLRARKTAKIICEERRIEIIKDDLLMETDAGDFSGKNLDEIDWDAYSKDSSVESGMHVMARALAFMNRLNNLVADNVLIVSHSGLIKNLAFILRGGKPEDYSWDEQPNIGNAEIVKIEWKK